MISKNKLKERLLDICNGAGYTWLEEGFFDSDPSTLECVGNVIQAIERVFDLPVSSRLRVPWYLQAFDDIETLTDLVYDAIQFDMEKK